VPKYSDKACPEFSFGNPKIVTYIMKNFVLCMYENVELDINDEYDLALKMQVICAPERQFSNFIRNNQYLSDKLNFVPAHEI
jgi:hypothetical protein